MNLGSGQYHYRFYYTIDPYSKQYNITSGTEEIVDHSITNKATWNWITKTFELTVINPEGAPDGVTYFATLYQPTRTFTVELKDPDQDGKYMGTIPYLDPGVYHYRFYYILDSKDTTIKEGDETLTGSKTNTAVWKWKVEKTFELTVINPGGAPSSTHYYASIWNSTWSKQIELTGDGGTYEGSVGDLDPGYYDWKIFCNYIINSITETDVIAHGENEHIGQTKINYGTWSWAGEISGRKWSDCNGNSIWDEGEDATGGWIIKLYKKIDDQWILLASTATEIETGSYRFSNLAPGEYRVEEESKEGWHQTFPTPDGKYYVTISLSNMKISDLNFGNHFVGLEVSKTTNIKWIETFEWSISKTACPSILTLEQGEHDTISYTIQLTKNIASDSYSVYGTIEIENPSDATASINVIDNVYDDSNIVATQDLGTHDIPSHGSITIDYSISFQAESGKTYYNKAHVYMGTYVFIGDASFSFTEPTQKVNDKVNVDDEFTQIPNGFSITDNTFTPQIISDSAEVSFSVTITNENAGSGTYQLINVATADGKSDDATVEVTVPGPSEGEYCTYTQGGWGSKPSGNNPGKLLHDNFGTLFQSGIYLGLSGHSMTFETADAITDYLPAGGTPGILDEDYTNPDNTSSGVFGGQVLALKLNVAFSDAGITPSGFGDLKLCNTGTSLDGKTVREILGAVNEALGGGSLPDGYTISQLNDLVTKLNEAFDGGTPSAWALGHLQH
jgi:hypothetical protein